MTPCAPKGDKTFYLKKLIQNIKILAFPFGG